MSTSARSVSGAATRTMLFALSNDERPVGDRFGDHGQLAHRPTDIGQSSRPARRVLEMPAGEAHDVAALPVRMDPPPFDLGQHRRQVRFGGGDLPGELTGPLGQRVVSHLRDLLEERRRHSTTLLGDHTGPQKQSR